MERLTKRSNATSHENGVCCTHFNSRECREVCGECAHGCKWEEEAWSKLAEYEDLEEQGLLLRLPCKVGDKVYLNNYGVVVGDTLEAIETNEKGFLLWGRESLLLGYFGETVFLTKEEAEAALAKMKEGV